MGLTEKSVIDKIEVVGEFKHIQIREATIIYRDNVEVSRTYHRSVLSPDCDLSGVDGEVKAISEVVWTPVIKKAWVEFNKE